MVGKRFYIVALIVIIAYAFNQRFGVLLLLLPIYGIYLLYKLHTDYIKVEAVCITYCKHRVWGGRQSPGYTTYDGVYKYTIDDKEYITTESATHCSFKPKVDEKCILYVNKNDYKCILPQSVVKWWCIMPWVFILFVFIFPTIFTLIYVSI